MSLPAPVILLPTNGADYTTDVQTQTLSGTTSTDSARVIVNGSSLGVSYTPGESVWSWTGNLVMGTNTYSIISVEKSTGNLSPATTINITYIQSDQFITISPPTGVRLREYQNQIEIICTQNPEPQTIGYNFYVSTSSGGVNGSYVKINAEPVNQYSFFEDVISEINRSVDTAGNIRVTTITEEITRTYYYSTFFTQDIFNAMVTNGQLPPVSFNEDQPFFFIATAVIYDPNAGQVTESAYSSELQGSPIIITTGIQDLPARTQNDIVSTFSTELTVANQGIDTKPGTVIRDLINPETEEMARYYVIQDFMARSLSVSALQDFDDSNGDGVSDDVSTSTKKSALKMAVGFTNDSDVQRLIDDQFDKLASNVNVLRKGATSSTGSVTFFTNTPPIRDMYVYEGAVVATLGDVDQGIPSQNYKTLTTKSITYATRDQYYNSQTGRYELEMDVECTDTGSAGNTDSYTVKSVLTGVDSNFQVENPNPISFGQDRESNHDMAGRIELALFADTGTEGGYVKTSIAITGVHGVRVEKAGDSLMIRDYDPIRKEHIGGKVDIYVQGEKEKQMTDQVAFSFGESAQVSGGISGETFLVINAASFQFKSQNSSVTAHTPIFEVSRVYNSTRAADYDITGYQIIGDGNTIDLDETLPKNVTIGLASTDTIKVDYKYRSSDTFVLAHQPVLNIVSVVGQLSGPLTSDNWDLVKLQDPLAEGGSTIAKDSIRIKFANNLPLTEFQTITDEPHTLVMGVDEPLDYMGIDVESIVITNTDKTTTYVLDFDYRVLPGTDTTPTNIRMIDTGRISNGQSVLVNYTAIENFTITYTTNDLLNTVQDQVNIMKHACADVIVKQSIENKVDFIITVVPKSGATNMNSLSSKIRTAVANYVTQLGVGISLEQSEIISLIQSIPDVDYLILPFLKMVKADGSFITRDNLSSPTFQIFNQGLSTSYITTIPVLTYKTTDKGGSENMFRGVFENQMPMVLQADPLDVSGGPGRAYIQSDGKIVVSTRDGKLPETKTYEVAYFVYGETGAKDINVASLEYLTVGNFTIIFDNPREQTKQAF